MDGNGEDDGAWRERRTHSGCPLGDQRSDPSCRLLCVVAEGMEESGVVIVSRVGRGTVKVRCDPGRWKSWRAKVQILCAERQASIDLRNHLVHLRPLSFFLRDSNIRETVFAFK